MQDRELYRQILGIGEPWFVERVDLQLAGGEVHVYLEHGETEWACSECGTKCRLHDHQAERRWRHLDTCQYRTILHAKVPRSDCPEHGPRVVKLPWAEPNSRFTALMEAIAIHWLKHASLKAVAKRLSLSWDEAFGIMKRAVQRGLERRKLEQLTYLGIDEKAYRKGHRYLTLVNDLEAGRVLYVGAEREQRSLDGFWSILSDEQLNGIKAVAIDMWDAYVNSLHEHLPEAEKKIVYDKFHIAQHLGEGIDEVRRQEHKQLRTSGNQTLKGTRWSWLTNPINMTWMKNASSQHSREAS